ncbi:MAG: hypothetical protein AAF804_08905 [Bacteroidota bacterium]
MARLLLTLLGSLIFYAVPAAIVTYPAPAHLEPSPHYAITISQGGEEFPVFTYQTEAQKPAFNLSESTAYGIFSFEGPIRVKVTCLKRSYRQASILPSSYGLVGSLQGQSFTFQLDRPRNLAIEFDGDLTHPLLLFANPLEEDVPDPHDPEVLFFGPGLHQQTDTIRPQAGQTIYLAGGAILSAHIHGHDVPDVQIKGRGILNGRRFGHSGGRLIHFTGAGSVNLEVEGITIVDAPGFYLTAEGAAARIRNVKGLGW